MSLKLNVATRGLLLVSIPLIFELVFIGSLYFMLKKAQQDTIKEAEAKTVVFQTNRLIKHVYNASATLFAYGVTKSDIAGELYDRHTTAINNGLSGLRLVLSKSQAQANQMEKLSQIESTTGKLLTLYQSIRSSIDEGGAKVSFVQKAETKAQFQAVIRKLINELDSFADNARKTEELAPAKLELSQEMIESILLLGVPLSILVAALVSFLFSTGITKRLSALKENAGRIGRGEPLLPCTDGGDEIAELDQVFRKMHGQIIDEQRLRQQIMAMVSHDLRSPAASMRIFLEALSQDKYGTMSTKGQEAAKMAYRSSTRILDLTGDLLDFERTDDDKMVLDLELVDLQVLCFEAVEAVSWLAEQNGVQFEVSEFAIQLQADERRLRRVLVNLLSNAVCYSKSSDLVLLKADLSSDNVTVHVIDHGPGIALENQAKIFDRFKQLEVAERKIEGGSGLGLSICKLVIESHGGKIGVESKPDAGCDFWFTLPLKR